MRAVVPTVTDRRRRRGGGDGSGVAVGQAVGRVPCASWVPCPASRARVLVTRWASVSRFPEVIPPAIEARLRGATDGHREKAAGTLHGAMRLDSTDLRATAVCTQSSPYRGTTPLRPYPPGVKRPGVVSLIVIAA